MHFKQLPHTQAPRRRTELIALEQQPRVGDSTENPRPQLDCLRDRLDEHVDTPERNTPASGHARWRLARRRCLVGRGVEKEAVGQAPQTLTGELRHVRGISQPVRHAGVDRRHARRVRVADLRHLHRRGGDRKHVQTVGRCVSHAVN